MTLILFTATAPNPLALELSRHGHQVFEALAISEVLALAEQHPLAQIIIDSTIGMERAKVIQHKFPTIALKPNATVQDILFELASTGGLRH